MNSLTWTIYIIDLLDKLQPILGISIAFFSIWFIFSKLNIRGPHDDVPIDLKNKANKKPLIGLFVCASILFIVPGKQTMMLMVASELGERIINSQRVTNVIDPSTEFLKEWLKKETARMATR